jgi:hypothetical protein
MRSQPPPPPPPRRAQYKGVYLRHDGSFSVERRMNGGRQRFNVSGTAEDAARAYDDWDGPRLAGARPSSRANVISRKFGWRGGRTVS